VIARSSGLLAGNGLGEEVGAGAIYGLLRNWSPAIQPNQPPMAVPMHGATIVPTTAPAIMPHIGQDSSDDGGLGCGVL
jgi:hypothetical protein